MLFAVGLKNNTLHSVHFLSESYIYASFYKYIYKLNEIVDSFKKVYVYK